MDLCWILHWKVSSLDSIISRQFWWAILGFMKMTIFIYYGSIYVLCFMLDLFVLCFNFEYCGDCSAIEKLERHFGTWTFPTNKRMFCPFALAHLDMVYIYMYSGSFFCNNYMFIGNINRYYSSWTQILKEKQLLSMSEITTKVNCLIHTKWLEFLEYPWNHCLIY